MEVAIDIAPLIENQPEREQEQEGSDDEEDIQPKGCLANWLSDPRTILFLSLCFFTGYISFIYEEGEQPMKTQPSFSELC